MHLMAHGDPDDAASGDLERWARRMSPPENELPAGVGVMAVLAHTDDAAVAVTGLEAYSTGFGFTLAVRLREARPDLAPGGPFLLIQPYVPHGGKAEAVEALLLLGLEYADGRRASTLDAGPFGPGGSRGDDDLVLIHSGGGGDDTRVDERFWVSPLPPAGPVTVVMSWPVFGVAESRVELDGDAIRAAAGRSRTLWPVQPPRHQDEALPPPRPSSGWFAQPPS